MKSLTITAVFSTMLLAIAPGATINGSLTDGDDKLTSGEYRDTYTFEGEAGLDISIELRSDDFDPYLILIFPSGEQKENDDDEGSLNSRISAKLAETGSYSVLVTSAAVGQTGNYTLTLPISDEPANGAIDRKPGVFGNQTLRDDKGPFDITLTGPKTVQLGTVFAMTIQITNHLNNSQVFHSVDIYRSFFDGFELAGSSIPFEVTGYESFESFALKDPPTIKPGQTYTLTFTLKALRAGTYTGGFDVCELAQAFTSVTPTVVVVDGGDAPTITGELDENDSTLSSGEYRDLHTVPVEAGQQVSIDLRSSDFDPYLLVVIPGQDTQSNDDHEGSLEHSHVSFTASEAGEIAIAVTSAAPNETGDYALTITTDGGGLINDGPALNTVTGTLATGDGTLGSGEYADYHQFEAVAGQPLVIDLRSDDFDPYLIVVPPGGDQQENDDFSGSSSHSRVEFDAPVAGTYRVVVTAFEKGEVGAYSLTLPADPAASSAAGDGVAAGVRRERGQLESSDPTLATGEYHDVYTFNGNGGETVVVSLRSEAFDPYLMLRGPGDCVLDNDDYEGSSSWSQIVTELPASGEFRVVVTTYKPGSPGSYDLVISRPDQGGAPVATAPIQGTLASGDPVLGEGEYADVYPLRLVPGSHVTVDLVSNDFDTYLALRSPSGEIVHNDDFEENANHSRIDHDVSEAGEYTVYVTSYKAKETGAYTLTITNNASAPNPGLGGDLVPISFGQTLDGILADNDFKLDGGEFSDIYAFEGEAGQNVVVDMHSDAFDTYIVLIGPSGVNVQNDDHGNSSSHSRIEMTLEDSGRYRILVTSYEAGKTGPYRVSVDRASSAPIDPNSVSPASGGNIHGIFVGISDYDRMDDLSYTDDDALRIFTALRDGAGMPENQGTLLIDSDATKAKFTAAIQRLANTTGPDDTVVVFFSGHGSRYPRPGGYHASDPDGKTETIELFDEQVTDEELNQLLNLINCGTQLIVVDSCFSGGLSKNIISRPGRMGLFSSPEDVTSMVAGKFRAGGYLSVFFHDALVEPYADSDENGEISCIELCHYISERYRSQVKSAPNSQDGDDHAIDWINPLNNLGYQTLVTDRGSILPNTPLFRSR